MATLNSAAKVEQRNGVPQKKRPLTEHENTASITKKEHKEENSTKRRKGCEVHTIAIGVEERS